MIVRKIIILLVTVAGIYPAYAKHVFIAGNEEFSDDFPWSKIFDDSSINEVDSYYFDRDSEENEGGNSKAYKICETPECKRVAEEFLNGMNKSVDPCENFYEFTCGGWAEKHPIPPSDLIWNRFLVFEDVVKHRVREILESRPGLNDIFPLRQARKWYKSCMNEAKLERRGVKPIELNLMQAGGWPMTMNDREWNGEIYSWTTVERYYAFLTGQYTLYKVGVADKRRIKIEEPELPLSTKFPIESRYTDKDDYDEYLDFIVKIASMFVESNGAEVSKKRITEEAKNIIEFEKEMYKMMQGNEVGMAKLKDMYESIDNDTETNGDSGMTVPWRSVLNGLFEMANVKLDSSIEVLVIGTDYVEGLDELLNKTSSRTIVNYIHWKFVSSMLRYTNQKMRKELYPDDEDPRWSTCVDEMQMRDAAAYEFVEKYFPKSAETAAWKMSKNIKHALGKTIMASNWLDEKSKDWAEDKLANMKFFIGYPEWARNKSAAVKHYKGLTIGAEYFDNILNFRKWNVMKDLINLYEMDDATTMWNTFINPLMVNAKYVLNINAFGAPAAIFQKPLFTPQLPENVNYGISGFVVGHEMSHGFDDEGIRFGKASDSTATLSEDVLKKFNESADCFTEQFDGYFKNYFDEETTESTDCEQSEKCHKKESMGLQKRHENIADSTGLQAAFDAYKNMRIQSSIAENKLPGLEQYTDEQLFFISFGATWCQVQKPLVPIKNSQAKDEHSPPQFRVIGSVSNTKDFAKVFNCPTGSPMNPSNKCNIWEKPEAAIKSKRGIFWQRRNQYR